MFVFVVSLHTVCPKNLVAALDDALEWSVTECKVVTIMTWTKSPSLVRDMTTEHTFPSVQSLSKLKVVELTYNWAMLPAV